MKKSITFILLLGLLTLDPRPGKAFAGIFRCLCQPHATYPMVAGCQIWNVYPFRGLFCRRPGEWVKSNERLTTEQYQQYVDVFNPVDFDAKKWAKIAKAAGMKYAVLTAKHHDGFCMFDSKLTDYKVSTRFGGRDIVREFLDAFRAEGLKVGLYYSLIDWHHPDYPNVGNHPQRDDKEYAKKNFNWDNYLKYMHGQVEELVKDYGKLDIMWFDYSFDEYSGEKWKARELLDMVHKYQPGIIVDNRLNQNEGTKTSGRMISKYGDFETPEQGIPDEAIVDKYGNAIPWETCLTLNNNWGYFEGDKEWKSPANDHPCPGELRKQKWQPPAECRSRRPGKYPC